MTNYILVLIRLVCLLTVLNGYGQENKWLTGTWNGVYFGEKSKLTKTFDTRLQITKVNGSSFEGIVQCILPSDTSVRLHTRITGRIYDHHIMTKLKEVLYFKDPPGRYTWAKHCNLCDSMKYTFEKAGDSVVLQGARRCDTLCNIVARYSKNIGSLVYKAAFLYEPDLSPRKLNAKTVGTPASTANTANASGTATTKAIATPANATNTANTTHATNAGGDLTKAVGTPAGTPNIAHTTNTVNTPNTSSTAKTANGANTGGATTKIIATSANATNTANTTNATNAGDALTKTAGAPANTPNTGNVSGTSNTSSTANTANAASAGGATANTATTGNGFNFVKPVYRDSMLGREVFAGRTVSTPNRYVINADSVEIRFMDNGIIDGDTISVFYNGQLIVPKLSLKEKPYIIKLPLHPDYPNRLVIHAESLGEYPPNTALVRIIYGKKEESFLLSSSMSKSGSIELMNNAGSTASTP
jgi:hypothetical protein